MAKNDTKKNQILLFKRYFTLKENFELIRPFL